MGKIQNIICSVTITSEIDPNSVELTWANNDSIITTDNRVTITPTNITENPSSFTYSTTIQFAYLMEGDKGNYTCNVAVDDMMESYSIIMQNSKSMYAINIKYTCNMYIFIHSTQSCYRGCQY